MNVNTIIIMLSLVQEINMTMFEEKKHQGGRGRNSERNERFRKPEIMDFIKNHNAVLLENPVALVMDV